MHEKNWLVRAADPDTPYVSRVSHFVTPLLSVWLIDDFGNALFRHVALSGSTLLKHIAEAGVLGLSFATVWHIMSRRNR